MRDDSFATEAARVTTEHEDIHPDVVRLVGRTLERTSFADVAEAIGNGLTRDGLLELLMQGEDVAQADETLMHYESLLRQQPPFRLECDADGNVHLVLMLGNRRLHTWAPVTDTVDAEVIALLGESLRSIVRQGIESSGGGTSGPTTALPELAGPDQVAPADRASRVVGAVRTRLGTSNALTELIGTGKSRDELLDMSLPELPEHAQAVLVQKLNEQPPFRLECDEDGGVRLLLIVSGERVHAWSPEELGLPPSRSWRRVAYPVLGGLFVLGVATGGYSGDGLVLSAMPLALYGMFDGFRFLRRNRAEMAWRAYWTAAVLWVLAAVTLESPAAGSVAMLMVIGRLGYLWIWINLIYPFTRGRDVLECPNCGVLTTHRVWVKDPNDACRGCGTTTPPTETGRRANWMGRAD